MPSSHTSTSTNNDEEHRILEESAENEEDGQAWCIVICCFLVNMIVMGFFKSIGIVLIELQNAFDASPADASILVSIMYFLNSISGNFFPN